MLAGTPVRFASWYRETPCSCIWQWRKCTSGCAAFVGVWRRLGLNRTGRGGSVSSDLSCLTTVGRPALPYTPGPSLPLVVDWLPPEADAAGTVVAGATGGVGVSVASADAGVVGTFDAITHLSFPCRPFFSASASRRFRSYKLSPRTPIPSASQGRWSGGVTWCRGDNSWGGCPFG